MIRKVKVNKLRPGIYIHDFGEKWMDHPFITKAKMVFDDWHIERIREYGIEEVYIDTTRGLDILPDPIQLDDWANAFESKKAKDKLLIKRRTWLPFREELVKAISLRAEVMEYLKNQETLIKSNQEFDINLGLELVDKIVKSVSRNRDALLSLRVSQNKDEYLLNHSLNVATLMAVLSRDLDLPEEIIGIFSVGALFHDFGKFLIPDGVLNKPGIYTKDEFKQMQEHPNHGVKLLSVLDSLNQEMIDLVLEHHERLDGSGYPKGLKGEEISLGGRLTGIIDFYDALSSDRCYKDQVSSVEVLKSLFELSGKEFDPSLLQVFIQSVGLYPVGKLVRLASGFLAIVIGSAKQDLKKPVVLLIYDTKKDRPITPRKLDLSTVGSLHQITGLEPVAKWQFDLIDLMKNNKW